MVTQRDPLEYLRSLPDAKLNNPAFDIDKVKGNVPRDQLLLAMNAFSHDMWHERAYVPEIGRKVMLIECNIRQKHDEKLEAEAVFELTVGREMCNRYGGLSGGCGALILEGCSISVITLMGIHMGMDISSRTADLNFKYLSAATLGAKIRIVSTSLSVRGRVNATRTQMYAGGRLLATATHGTMSAPREARTASA